MTEISHFKFKHLSKVNRVIFIFTKSQEKSAWIF